jgi:hypothetical protein
MMPCGRTPLSSVYNFFSDRAPTTSTVTGNSARELPAHFGIRVASNLAGRLPHGREAAFFQFEPHHLFVVHAGHSVKYYSVLGGYVLSSLGDHAPE